MPFNGSGVYTAPAADFPVVTQTVISSTHFNNTINDIATALSTCLTKDGQQTATANINFGGFRATNVGITGIAGSVGTPAINVSDVGTGLYRSAASELAVTVAGSQVARFASTGLIVTGAASVSTTLTASTSVVTPLVGTDAAVPFILKAGGANMWSVNNTGGHLTPVNAGQTIGDATHVVADLFTPIIDTGTTGSLSLKTNNGVLVARFDHVASAVNFLAVTPAAATVGIQTYSNGTDTNVAWNFGTRGSGAFSFFTDYLNTQVLQFQVLHAASSNRNITVTGSNGGNPTIGVTAGNLAITPSVVLTGGVSGNLTVTGAIAAGSNPAAQGDFRGTYTSTGGVWVRNSANSADLSAITAVTVNTVVDVFRMGVNSAGILMKARSGGAAPTTSDLASGEFTVWRDTGGATTKVYYNNAGVIQSVALA